MAAVTECAVCLPIDVPDNVAPREAIAACIHRSRVLRWIDVRSSRLGRGLDYGRGLGCYRALK